MKDACRSSFTATRGKSPRFHELHTELSEVPVEGGDAFLRGIRALGEERVGDVRPGMSVERLEHPHRLGDNHRVYLCYRNKGWKSMLHFGVTSNEDSLRECQDYLMRICKLYLVKLVRSTPRSSPSLRCCGCTQVSRIFHLFYSDATIWLSRKRDKVAHLL